MLNIIYDHHKLSEDAGALYELTDLMKVKMKGDRPNHTQLTNFRHVWQHTLAGMKTSPTLDILETFVHERFRDCDCLKEDIANYERFASVHEDKSYKFL